MSKCRYCDDGYSLRGGDHFIVKSIMPAKINIVRCKNEEEKCRSCGMINCQCDNTTTTGADNATL